MHSNHIYFVQDGRGKAAIPTDPWLSDLLVKNVSTKGILMYGKHMKDKDIVIKLSKDNNDEYMIYKLLDKMKTKLSNIPYVYANMSCYERKDVIDSNFKRIKGLCNGSKDDPQSQKIYLSVIEYIDKSTTLDGIGNHRLPDNQMISLIFQGLFTLYQMYYVFGIIHKDLNGGNILVQHTDKKTLDYKIKYSPYRFFPFEVDIGDCANHTQTYTIDTHGMRLYLIDFDQAYIYHHDYNNADIKHTIMDDVHAYMVSVLSKASPTIVTTYTTVYTQCFERIKECCLRYQQKYVEDRTPHNNNYMIEKTTSALRVYIDYVRKAFNMPLSYKL
jgi:serine/threonine protein kinase